MKKKTPLGGPIPIRLTAHTEAAVENAVAKLGWKDQEVLRLSVQIGLTILSELDYKIPEILAKVGLRTIEGKNEVEPATTYPDHEPQNFKVAEPAGLDIVERAILGAAEEKHMKSPHQSDPKPAKTPRK